MHKERDIQRNEKYREILEIVTDVENAGTKIREIQRCHGEVRTGYRIG